MKRRHFIASVPLVALTPQLYPHGAFGAVRTDRKPVATGDDSLPAVTSYTDRWALALSTSSPPDPEAGPGAPAWADTPPLSGFVTPFFNADIDAQHEIRLLHDDSHLYVGFEYTSEGATESLVGLELLLSLDAQTYYRVPVQVRQVNPGYANTWGPDVTDINDAESTVTDNGDTIGVVVTIPFASMGIDSVSAGDELRFNALLQHAMMTKPLSSWVPIRTSMNNYNGGDSAGVEAEVTAEARLGAVFLGTMPTGADSGGKLQRWTPDELTLRYRSFTEKELSFTGRGDVPRGQLELHWLAPDGSLAELDDVDVRLDGDAVRVAFAHPGPHLNGWYELHVIATGSGEGTPDQLTIVGFDRYAMIRAGDARYAKEQ